MQSKGQNLVICVDTSGSMAGIRIKTVNDAIEAMLPNLSSQRGTMLALTGFNDKPFYIKPLTFPNNRELIGKVRSVKVGGCTNLLGGIDLSMDLLIRRARCFTRRVILLTDGQNNVASLTKEQIIKKAQRNQIVLDTIGIGEAAYTQPLLIELAQTTGGEFIAVKDLPKLLATFRRLSAPKQFRPNSGGRSKIIPFNLFRRY